MNKYIEIMKDQLSKLNLKKCSVWLENEENYGTFLFFPPDKLDEEQIGYSRMESGESLIGSAPGDWLEGWVVIGSHEDFGDPLFVDSANPKLPVFTAEHGVGEWEAILLYKSWEEFKNSMA